MYEMPEEKVIVSGGFEKIGLPMGLYKIKYNGYEGYVTFVKYEYSEESGAIIVSALFEAKAGIELMKFDIISLEGMKLSVYEMEIVKPIKDFNFSDSVVPVVKGSNNIILEDSKESKYIQFDPVDTTQRRVQLFFDKDNLDNFFVNGIVVNRDDYVVTENSVSYVKAGINVSNPIISIEGGVLKVQDSVYVPSKFILSAKAENLITKQVVVEALEPIDVNELYVANKIDDGVFSELEVVENIDSSITYKIYLPNNSSAKIGNTYKQANVLFGYGTETAKTNYLVGDNYTNNILIGDDSVYDYLMIEKGKNEVEAVRCFEDEETKLFGVTHTITISQNYLLNFKLSYSEYSEYFDGVNINLLVEVCTYPEDINVYISNDNELDKIEGSESIVIYSKYKGNINGTEVVAKVVAGEKELVSRTYTLDVDVLDQNGNSTLTPEQKEKLRNCFKILKKSGERVKLGQTLIDSGTYLIVSVSDSINLPKNVKFVLSAGMDATNYKVVKTVDVKYVSGSVEWTTTLTENKYVVYNIDNKYDPNKANQDYYSLSLRDIAGWYDDDAENYEGFLADSYNSINSSINNKIENVKFDVKYINKDEEVVYFKNDRLMDYIYLSDVGSKSGEKCSPVLNFLFTEDLGECEITITLPNQAKCVLRIIVYYNLPGNTYLTLGTTAQNKEYRIANNNAGETEINLFEKVNGVINQTKLSYLSAVVGDVQSFNVNLVIGLNNTNPKVFNKLTAPSGMKVNIKVKNTGVATVDDNGIVTINGYVDEFIISVSVAGKKDVNGIATDSSVDFDIRVVMQSPIREISMTATKSGILTKNTLNNFGGVQSEFMNKGVVYYSVSDLTNETDIDPNKITWNVYTQDDYTNPIVSCSVKNQNFQDVSVWGSPDGVVLPEEYVYYYKTAGILECALSENRTLDVQIHFVLSKDKQKVAIWATSDRSDYKTGNIEDPSKYNTDLISGSINVEVIVQDSYTTLSGYDRVFSMPKMTFLTIKDNIRISQITPILTRNLVTFDLRNLKEGVDYIVDGKYYVMNETENTTYTLNYFIKTDEISSINDNINLEIVKLLTTDMIDVEVDEVNQAIKIMLKKLFVPGSSEYIEPDFNVTLCSKSSQIAINSYSVSTTIEVVVEDGKKNPYSIRTQAQLQNIENNLASNYIIMNDINLDENFRIIGSYYNKFTGSIKGYTEFSDGSRKYHSINNLIYNIDLVSYFDLDDPNFVLNNVAIGLFASADNATFDGITIKGVNIKLDLDNPISYTGSVNVYVGALVGYATTSNFSNNNVDDSNNLQNLSGALIKELNQGLNEYSSLVKGIYATGDTTGNNFVAGGLIGSIATGSNKLINNSASIVISDNRNGNKNAIGGLVGTVEAETKISYEGISSSGGKFQNAQIICVINPHLFGSTTLYGSNLGGVVGKIENSNVVIDNAVVRSVIFGDSNIGGIAGSSNGTISNSKVMPTLLGVSEVGGVVGSSEGQLKYNKVQFLEYEDTYAYFNSAIIGTKNIGGLVGDNKYIVNNTNLEDKYNSYNSIYSYVGMELEAENAPSNIFKNTEVKYYGDIVYFKFNDIEPTDTISVAWNGTTATKELYFYAEANVNANNYLNFANAEKYAIYTKVFDLNNGSIVEQVNGDYTTDVNGSIEIDNSLVYTVDEMNDDGYENGKTHQTSQIFYRYKIGEDNLGGAIYSNVYVLDSLKTAANEYKLAVKR